MTDENFEKKVFERNGPDPVEVLPHNLCAKTATSHQKIQDGISNASESKDFDVFLTVHLSIFIVVLNQLDAQNLFYNKCISCLYMFRAPCAHRQEVKNCIIQPLVSLHL